MIDDNPLLKKIQAQVYMIRDNLPVSDTQYKRFQHATQIESDLQLLKRFIEESWPSNRFCL